MCVFLIWSMCQTYPIHSALDIADTLCWMNKFVKIGHFSNLYFTYQKSGAGKHPPPKLATLSNGTLRLLGSSAVLSPAAAWEELVVKEGWLEWYWTPLPSHGPLSGSDHRRQPLGEACGYNFLHLSIAAATNSPVQGSNQLQRAPSTVTCQPHRRPSPL